MKLYLQVGAANGVLNPRLIVVAAVEEILRQSGHVANIFSGQDNEAVAGEDMLCARLSGGQDLERDTLRHLRARDHSRPHRFGVGRGRVSDDEKRFGHGSRSPQVRLFETSWAKPRLGLSTN